MCFSWSTSFVFDQTNKILTRTSEKLPLICKTERFLRGAKQLGPLNTEPARWSIKASWEVETSQEWEDYCQWVSEQFNLDFKTRRVDDSKLVFVKHLRRHLPRYR